MGESVGFLVVHGEEDLATLHGGRDPSGGSDCVPAGCDADLVVGADAQLVSVIRVDFGVDRCRVEFS